MTAYYNEIDPYAAQWLRNLIAEGNIAPGDVDERDIRDVLPSDLREYTQCHFFAGIGVWSYALRRARWPDERPVWTGSPPCQPFSAAGRKGGTADERHLWPHLYHLIRECGPAQFFGEQVASKDGLAWLDLVQADMEAANYAGGAFDLCAASVGAPHIRQRQFLCFSKRLAYGLCAGPQGCDRPVNMELHGGTGALRSVASCSSSRDAPSGSRGEAGRLGPTNGLWGTADWLFCRDGNWRPVEPGTFPLAHGVTERVGRLRAYGNAIVSEVAATLIATFLEHETETATTLTGSLSARPGASNVDPLDLVA